MPDTPATPAAAAPQPAPAAPVPSAPAPIPAPVTGEQLVPVKGPRPILDPGDASPLGHPAGAEPALVPPGAVIEGAVEVVKAGG